MHVAATLHAECADDVERGTAQPLMHRIGKRLDGGNHDAIARMYAEWVDVLHRADCNAGPLCIAHHLILNLLPANEAALHHHLTDRARAQATSDALPVLLLRHHDPTTRPAEREGWSHDRRESDLGECRRRRRVARRRRLPLNDRARRRWLTDAVTHCPEELAILRHLDRRKWRAEEANRMSLKDASI